MKNHLIKDAIGWGIGLWFFGYVLGFIFFMFVPVHLIGWYITPIATLVTIWVIFKKISGSDIYYYLKVATSWLIIAVLFDYLFLVQLLNPEDGYYKPDAFFYYALTLLLPLIVGWYKINSQSNPTDGTNSNSDTQNNPS